MKLKLKDILIGMGVVATIFFSSLSYVDSQKSLSISLTNQEAIKPFQEPILDIENGIITYHYENYSDSNLIEIDINFDLENIGKGIAEDVRIILYACLLDSPDNLKKLKEASFVNNIYPQQSMKFNLNMELNTSLNEYLKILSGSDIALIIRLECTEDKLITRDIWSKFYIESNGLFHMEVDEKEIILPYYEELISE